jgi:hypothetical protein
MINQNRISPARRRHNGRTVHATLLSLGLLLVGVAPVHADTGSAAGRSLSEPGLLLGRPKAGEAWQVIPEKEALPAGALLIGLAGAQLDSENGAIRLSFLGNLDGLSPFPIIESAVTLQSSPQVDLDFALDLGRVELVNNKTGPARVRVRVRDTLWDLTLAEPGTSVVFELYGRWARGIPFSKKIDPRNVPTATLLMLVAKGALTLKHAGVEHSMNGPPGPALMEWDSVSGQDEAPQRLEKLPAWGTPEARETAEVQRKKALLEKFRQSLATKGIDATLEDFLNSDDPLARRGAVYALGALDQLPRLGQALREAKYPDVWENGVIALRHWIGRGPGQDQILYNGLIDKAHYKPVQAETVLQLLHSFGDEQLARPETYQSLIDYLDHDLLAIRCLAYWHLYRLAPAGRDLGYNPVDAKQTRDAAVEKWRKLIPPGQLPDNGKPSAAH